jgi:hypothetical protein
MFHRCTYLTKVFSSLRFDKGIFFIGHRNILNLNLRLRIRVRNTVLRVRNTYLRIHNNGKNAIFIVRKLKHILPAFAIRIENMHHWPSNPSVEIICMRLLCKYVM